MYREWSFADGPADLTDQDIRKSLYVTVNQPTGNIEHIQLDIESVGPMFGGAIRCFSGQFHIDRTIFRVIGTYNTSDRTGACHSTDA